MKLAIVPALPVGLVLAFNYHHSSIIQSDFPSPVQFIGIIFISSELSYEKLRNEDGMQLRNLTHK